MQKILILAAAAMLAGCGQQQTLKYRKGECTYAGNRTDREHTGTNTNNDGRTGRKTGEARRSDDGIKARSIEEVLGLHRQGHSVNEFGGRRYPVGTEQDNGHIQLTLNHEMQQVRKQN